MERVNAVPFLYQQANTNIHCD